MLQMSHATNCESSNCGRVQHSRRVLLLAVARATLALTPSAGVASMPIPEPLDHIELLEGYTRWLCTGRLNRILYLPFESEKKLFTPGQVIPSPDIRLVEKSDSYSDTVFLEVIGMKPHMAREKISKDDARSFNARVSYVHFGVSGPSERISIAESMVGRPHVFLISSRTIKYGEGTASFPSPLFRLAERGNWRDAMPFPIEEFSRLLESSRQFGFIAR
jgi:hypothetical protein